MPQTVETALAELASLHPKRIDLGLDRIKRVLKALGNPQDKLPPTLHVAGTNGKGSTIAYVRAMAEAQGLRVHVYTSPHLVRFNERIVLASQQIQDDVLVDILSRVRAANGDEALSFFEATTAAMLLAFSESPADLCILEVGLGGRFDATNVITPALTAIAPIDYDHAEFLGTDLAGIAREKAGIFKRHTPALIGAQLPLVAAVLDAECNKLGITPKILGQDFRSFKQHGRLVYEDETALLDLPLPALSGEHQIQNAGLAIACARQLQLSSQAISRGLETVSWPARLQCLSHKDNNNALADMVRGVDGELWLDGGHNPHAARAVAAKMADLEARNPRPLILIMGMLANKDIDGYFDAFKGLAQTIIGVDIPEHASFTAQEIALKAADHNFTGQAASSLIDATQRAVQVDQTLPHSQSDEARIAPRILICGSLYLAGEVLKL